MEETIKSIQAVLDGNLVVGDHDSITLLGAAAQNDLNEASRLRLHEPSDIMALSQ